MSTRPECLWRKPAVLPLGVAVAARVSAWYPITVCVGVPVTQPGTLSQHRWADPTLTHASVVWRGQAGQGRSRPRGEGQELTT